MIPVSSLYINERYSTFLVTVAIRVPDPVSHMPLCSLALLIPQSDTAVEYCNMLETPQRHEFSEFQFFLTIFVDTAVQF
jgi:hypothetical protein